MIDLEKYPRIRDASEARRVDEERLAAFLEWAVRVDAENARRLAEHQAKVAVAAESGALPPERPQLLPKDAAPPFDESNQRQLWRDRRRAALAGYAEQIAIDVTADLARIEKASAPLKMQLAALELEAASVR